MKQSFEVQVESMTSELKLADVSNSNAQLQHKTIILGE